MRFVLAMARREARATLRRLALYAGAITLGVAALVAINSFRANVAAAIHRESRGLLGADLELRSREPFPDSLRALVDSVAAAGTDTASVTSLASMVMAERTGLTRLAEVRAVAGGYPFYGAITTVPAVAWAELGNGPRAVVDEGLLVYLQARLGDTLVIGDARFTITGTLRAVPGEVGLRAAIGPRVYIAGRYLAATGLLQFGSRASHRLYFRMESDRAVQRFVNHYHQRLRAWGVGFDTVGEREEELGDALDTFARFLALVGFVALLLGGVGVASAVHVFVKDKVPTVAVLRCLGATQSTSFAIYLLQAGAIGLTGAVAGAGLGIAVQQAVPALVADLLPLSVPTRIHWPSVGIGIGLGAWVAFVFALLPLLEIRNVTPLQALRFEVQPIARRVDPVRLAAYGAIVGSVVSIASWQAPRPIIGLAFAAGLAAGVVILAGIAQLLRVAARRALPRGAPFALRQGIANLFRPHNQTLAVTLAVGFGVFLVATLDVVQRNLLDRLAFDTRPDRPNLVLFDIQPDQRRSVEAILARHAVPVLDVTPIVPARIAAINGIRGDSLMSLPPARSRWALRREYRHTYRDTLVGSERLVAGSWWRGPRAAGALARVSLEEDIARELAVGVGDRIAWDVQGIEIETQVANLRRVNWARFEPNFFVVFEPGVLEEAPHTLVTLLRIDDPRTRALVQQDLVRAHPNLSALDLATVQETVETITGAVTVGIRFMALFSVLCGMIVLAGAIATSRYQRLKESVLLRTIGARGHQVLETLTAEYAVLGTLAGVTGCALAVAAGWGLLRFFFELPFRPAVLGLIWLVLGTALLTAAIGLWSARQVLRAAPLAVLRSLGD